MQFGTISAVANHVVTVLGLIHFGVIQILDPVVGVVG